MNLERIKKPKQKQEIFWQSKIIKNIPLISKPSLNLWVNNLSIAKKL
jgi:hypothetical protein